MSKKSIKRLVSLFIMLAVIVAFSSCSGKDKKITISNDVGEENARQDQQSIKVEKIKDIDMTALEGYNFVCWKDDENLIFDKHFGTVKYYDTGSEAVGSETVDYYNYNLSSSELTKIVSLTEAGNNNFGNSVYGQLNPASKKVVYIKDDNKLWAYNFLNNENKAVCDLTEIKNVLESDFAKAALVKTNDSIEVQSVERSDSGKGGFTVDNAWYYPLLGVVTRNIEYTDRYICISYKPTFSGGNGLKKLYIADMETGKLTECPVNIDGAPITRDNPITYNKQKDTFYIEGMWYNKKPVNVISFSGSVSAVYEFKLTDNVSYKKVSEQKDSHVLNISEDGKYIYYATARLFKGAKPTYDSYGLDSVIKYDIEQNSFTDIFKNNSETRYAMTLLNYKNNLVWYSVGDDKLQQTAGGIGFLSGDKINELTNSQMLEDKDIYFNDNGNKVLGITEEPVEMSLPKATGYTLYEIKN